MASYTPNFNLKKPADSDSYDIADHNGNMDIIDTALNTLDSNSKKVQYSDFEIGLTSSTGRTVSVSASMAGYKLIGATFVQNDDLYYLTTTDGIYPNLSVVDGAIQYIQLLGMNKSFAQVGANRTIKIRGIYTKV